MFNENDTSVEAMKALGMTPTLSEATAPKTSELSGVAEWLEECKLDHLVPQIGSATVPELRKLVASSSRKQMLDHFRALNVDKLHERQALANSLTKALRHGRLGPDPEAEAKAAAAAAAAEAEAEAEAAAAAAAAAEAEAKAEADARRAAVPASAPTRSSVDVSDDGPRAAPFTRDAESTLRRFDAFHKRHAWKVLEPVDAVYGLSDLHADAAQNMNLLLRMEAQPNSALVIAGDAATDFAVFEKLLTMLVSKFKHVCYVVGNHELWSNPRRTAARPMWDGDWMKVEQPRDGLEKLLLLMESAVELGAHAYPVLVGTLPTAGSEAGGEAGGGDGGNSLGSGGSSGGGGVALVPLQSWFQPDFLGDGARSGMTPIMMAEFACPEWLEREKTADGTAVSRFFAKLNRCSMADVAGTPEASSVLPRGWPVVSFSHFLPEPGLHRGYNWLSDYEGSRALGAQVRELSAATRGAGCTHVFGHTHFSMDKTIDGVRYVQQPLGNPGERGNGWQIHCDEAAPYARVWPMRSRSFMEGRLPLHGSGSPAALPGGFARRQN